MGIQERINSAFEDIPWRIVDSSGLNIPGNRHFTVKFTGVDAEGVDAKPPEGKIPSEVYQAVESAGYLITGTYTGVDGENTVRIWVKR